MRATLTTCAVVIIILLALLVRCCNDRTQLREDLEISGADRDFSTAHLIIDKRSAGDWIQFSTLPTVLDCDPTAVTVGYRPAVLFQFGAYESQPDFFFDEIWIYKNGSVSPEVIKREDTEAGVPLPWINIVSDYDGRPSDPLAPDEIFGFYPDNGLPGTCTERPCERNRTIHSDMSDVQAMMTYWPGVDGYAMKAVQPQDDTGKTLLPCLGNRYRFRFEDPFRVEIYYPAYPDAGAPVIYKPGVVDSIVVQTDERIDPERDEMVAPPWPRP